MFCTCLTCSIKRPFEDGHHATICVLYLMNMLWLMRISVLKATLLTSFTQSYLHLWLTMASTRKMLSKMARQTNKWLNVLFIDEDPRTWWSFSIERWNWGITESHWGVGVQCTKIVSISPLHWPAFLYQYWEAVAKETKDANNHLKILIMRVLFTIITQIILLSPNENYHDVVSE